MTWLDTSSFAKGGGNVKGDGGKNSGGGGTSTTAPDSGIVGTYYAGLADGEAGYDIKIDFKGTGWTDGLRKAFTDSADYLTNVITDDIGGGGYYNSIYVDDLYIIAELKPIDGTGVFSARRGRKDLEPSELTSTGSMQFDSADALNYLNKGLWDDIITHEMMHVLGFGTLWNYGTDPLVPKQVNISARKVWPPIRPPVTPMQPTYRSRPAGGRNRRRALVRVGARQRIDDPLHQRLQLPVEFQSDVAGRSRLQRPAATLVGKSHRLRRPRDHADSYAEQWHDLRDGGGTTCPAQGRKAW